MKRFASLATAVALTGSFIGAATDAQADPAMYLVPISNLRAIYAPCSIVQVASVLDFGPRHYAFTSVPVFDVYTNGNALDFTAGTYTIASYSFPISPKITGNSATVYLPTPYGYSNTANSADGAFQRGISPLCSILSKDIMSINHSESLSFPNANGKYNALTFKVAVVPEPGSVALLFGIGTVGVVIFRKRRNR